MNATNPQRGFSIVELMVASTIGLILLAGATALLVNSGTNYQTTDSIARLQENARFALEFIARDLRNAGYYGCTADLGGDAIKSQLKAWDKIGDQQLPNPIEGFEATTGTWYPSSSTATNGSSKSDSFVIRYVQSDDIRVRQPMPNEAANLFVDPGHGLKTGDIIMVSDCDTADIFQLTNVQEAGGGSDKDGLVHNSGAGPLPGNASSKLQKVYNTTARIYRFNNLEYSIRKGKSGLPALFRENDELVEGIENIQILYGLDENSSRRPTKYVTADKITSVEDWKRNVVSIRIGLLVSAVVNNETGEIGSDANVGPYDLNLTPSTTADDVDPKAVADSLGLEFRKNVARQQFFATINLRNIR